MKSHKIVEVLHFSDVLCIWAYVAQIRIDELKTNFGEKVRLHYHFIPIFGAVQSKITQNWKERGGWEGYSQHVQEVATKFAHVQVHPHIWQKNQPLSSLSCHLFLKAVQLYEVQESRPGLLEQVAWAMRLAFFKELVNIAERRAQWELLEQFSIPQKPIQTLLEDGAAFAALELDLQAREQYHVKGSPTLIFNEGRQKIYGNVGYRVIEANIRELLYHSENQASWC